MSATKKKSRLVSLVIKKPKGILKKFATPPKKSKLFFTIDGIEYNFDIMRIKRIYTANTRQESDHDGKGFVFTDTMCHLTIVSDKGEDWTHRISKTEAGEIVKAVNKYKKPIKVDNAREWDYYYG